MTKEDYPRYRDLMGLASEASGKRKSEALLSMEFKMLEGFSFEDVSRAIYHHMTTNKFAPHVSEILAYLQGTPAEQSSVAWAKVQNALSLHGTYNSVQFDDPHIHYAIVRMGGWMQIGKIDEDQAKWAQKEFDRYYQESVRLGTTWDHLGPHKTLLGCTDAGNNREGRELMEPVRTWEKIDAPVVPELPAPAGEQKMVKIDLDLSKIGRRV